MKTLLIGTCLAAAAITAQPTLSNLRAGSHAFERPAAGELSTLRALDTGSLAKLRGGSADTRDPLTATERSRLQQAQVRFAELADLRAGDDNSTLITILIVVAIVAIVLIII